MKRKINKIVSLMLVFCIMVSLVTVTGISANAATTDEVVASKISGDYTYKIYNGYAKIINYSGSDTELVIPSTIDGYTVKYIGDNSYIYENQPIIYKIPITSVTIPDTVTEIGENAFRNCETLTHVNIPDSVTIIGDWAFQGCDIDYWVLNKNVVYWGGNAFENVRTIYVPKGIVKDFQYSFDFTSHLFSDIYFEGSKEEWALVEPDYLKYNGRWIKVHYNHTFAKPAGFAKVVSDDFTLNLTQEKGNVQSGEMVLQPGTYQFNIQKGDIFNVLDGKNIFGYNKTINDSTSGSLTCKPSFKIKTTLVATGGTYNFAFNTVTNALSVKRTGDIPKVYITNTSSHARSLHLPLKPIKGTNIWVGSVYLPNTGFRFKINKNGVELGDIENPPSLSSYTPIITLSDKKEAHAVVDSDGGMITFTFNYDTNQIAVKEIIDNDAVTPRSNIHITVCDFNKTDKAFDKNYDGDFTLDLDDNNGESDRATGTITLKKGYYSFKVYNRGVACGSNSIYYNAGTRTLSPNFMLPSVLYASGDKYKFTFEKSTGRLFIHRA